MSELIENDRVIHPERARESRVNRRLAERAGFRLLAKGGQRYADAVLEGLGSPDKAWMTCSSCKRPYVQEWAVKEMGRAMERAMGHPTVAMQVFNLIGADPDMARTAVNAFQQAQQLDEPARLELFRAALEEAGWTCLPPAMDASKGATDGNGNGNS